MKICKWWAGKIERERAGRGGRIEERVSKREGLSE
jgi:hypothetical protein